MTAKKFVFFWLASAVARLYTTFLVQSLWNWFITEAFHLSQIPFWVMYGVMLTISVLTFNPNDFQEKQWVKELSIAVNVCVPENMKDFVSEQIEEQKKDMWIEAGSAIFGTAVGNTFTLFIGWAVHAFFV